MYSLTEFERLVEAQSGLRKGEFVILEVLDEKIFASLPLAVILVHAPWSSSSARGLVLIGGHLRSPEFTHLPFFVVDIGNVDLPLSAYEGIRFGGFGETFLIRDGKVTAKLSNYSKEDNERIREAIKQLL